MKATTNWFIDYIKAEAAKAEEQQDDIYWTDASKYAKEHYGEVYESTTRFDNDYWDDV